MKYASAQLPAELDTTTESSISSCIAQHLLEGFDDVALVPLCSASHASARSTPASSITSETKCAGGRNSRRLASSISASVSSGVRGGDGAGGEAGARALLAGRVAVGGPDARSDARSGARSEAWAGASIPSRFIC